MEQQKFIKFWNEVFPNSIPISHQMKTAFPERWVRFHSLPHSKRYADSDEEYEIILCRQNELLKDLIGEDEDVIILFVVFKDDNVTYEDYQSNLDLSGFSKINNLKFNKLESDNELEYELYVKTESWKLRKWDKALKAIADDEIRVMFISPSRKCLIAPYDGGIDIIGKNSFERDKIKIQFRNWLPKNAEGL